MELAKVLSSEDIEFLIKQNIEVLPGKYTTDQVVELMQTLDLLIAENIDDNDHITPTGQRLENIQDKLINY